MYLFLYIRIEIIGKRSGMDDVIAAKVPLGRTCHYIHRQQMDPCSWKPLYWSKACSGGEFNAFELSGALFFFLFSGLCFARAQKLSILHRLQHPGYEKKQRIR